MIPICSDPKRFVCALNATRALSRKRIDFRLVGVRVFSSLRSPATTLKPRSFSTKLEPISTSVPPALIPIQANALTLHGARSAEWWTGKNPNLANNCPGVVNGKIYSIPQVSFSSGECTKEKLQEYFDNTWALTESLFSALQGEEAFTLPPYHKLRHPMIFYYGHPAALYINKLRVAGLLKEPINPYFETIFETGVDEMSWDDMSKNEMPWPAVSEVHAYRKMVYKTVSSLIQNLSSRDLQQGITQSSPLWALVMAFEHERIHLETSSFLMTEMPLKYLRAPEHFPAYHSSADGQVIDASQGHVSTLDNISIASTVSLAHVDSSIANPVAGVDFPVNQMVPVATKTVEIGKPRDFPTFGWDNEYGHRSFEVPSFRASKYKVTNGEFHEFVKEGGYASREYWSEAGWKWRAYRNVKWPLCWIRVGPQGQHTYNLRVMFDEVHMQWNWPVLVNFHEADAFARWKAKKSGKQVRVLTELEHRAIRDPQHSVSKQHGAELSNDMVAQVSGHEMLDKGFNLNLHCSSMSPVDALPANSQGFHDVFGNAWEWTPDYFSALPGFEVHPYYEDFSTPCFDGLHHIIQGGSFISTGNEASVHARFHFRPHFHQHASFRLVEPSVADVFTSDTDAPAPYVGAYPFRRTKERMLELMNASAQQKHLALRDVLVSQHYGNFGSLVQSLMGSLGIQSGAVSASIASQSNWKRVEDLILHHSRMLRLNSAQTKVIDVGCGVGGLTFALLKHFPTVMGFDHHAEAIELAQEILKKRQVRYSTAQDGPIDISLSLSDNDMLTRQVDFRVADPMCLPAELSGFDIAVINDVVDKVTSPNSVLGRLSGVRGLLKPGGLLVVISAFEWREETTPQSLWIGGHRDPLTGQVASSADALKHRLREEFSLLHETAVPMLWTHSRSFQGKPYQILLFQRK